MSVSLAKTSDAPRSAPLAFGDIVAVPGSALRAVRHDDGGESVTISAGLGLAGTVEVPRGEITAVWRFTGMNEVDSPDYGPRETYRP